MTWPRTITTLMRYWPATNTIARGYTQELWPATNTVAYEEYSTLKHKEQHTQEVTIEEVTKARAYM